MASSAARAIDMNQIVIFLPFISCDFIYVFIHKHVIFIVGNDSLKRDLILLENHDFH